MVSPRSLSLSRFLLQAQWMSKKVGGGGLPEGQQSVREQDGLGLRRQLSAVGGREQEYPLPG